MNHKGLLTAWSDDKGFGFITPAVGGERVFAHISAYTGRGRPSANREVRYSLTEDPQGRIRAGKFQYAGIGRLGASVAPGFWLALIVAAGVIGGLSSAYVFGYLPVAIPAAYAGMSLLALVTYGIDKAAAVKGHRRVPENRLHLFELLCGWPGALIAQQLFRHKTRKGSFQFGFWVCVIFNLGALGWLLFWPEAAFARRELGIEHVFFLSPFSHIY
ncbi:DUF1294 domain-containing protein [Marinobacter sp. F4206]|uniref:DUF1294 domain-containing protein n=1 Tax=Marinobacter sp. F4206 TaxID=2861777 RepID=UPI001C5E5952|nr:cold shock and DUF1294 domain-containing protein [Marinobacter sp. F4206]MBW4934126.1 cold shock and DUF1294 domain-containing protein [Marinobacter sp. F4206]